ncbi:hypothetical protein B0H17DRAFT_943095 [Mycena rosella]|uniref:Uncharacterized protein n=1 Tax=Mycena rosella TaxID=1033263 RepID=A0AAD7D9X0_MYCRO|nr:hypothetical protein B0H17DRAFT_943095 [Mycena rosella]
MYNGLSCLQCSVLTQLRTAHVGLNTYLFRFHLAPSPDCALCLIPEMVPHFLLSCPLCRRQRIALIQRLGTTRLSLRCLIAAKVDPKPTLEVVRSTGRFPWYSF